MKKTFAAFLFIIFACRLVSQTAAGVSLLTVNDGLSRGMIFDILQSKDGFIWIATKDRLNRYTHAIRLHRHSHLLQTPNLSFSGIDCSVGHAAFNNFSDAFVVEFGKRPAQRTSS